MVLMIVPKIYKLRDAHLSPLKCNLLIFDNEKQKTFVNVRLKRIKAVLIR